MKAVASILRAEGLTIGRTRLHQIAAGQGPPPSAVHLERLAQVLGVGPSYFAEYRLWKVRSLLDPNEVGFERAMDNLGRLNGRRERPRILDGADSPASAGSRYPSRVSKVKEHT
jgi:transcriptional regulator with XRE-family HTH domain